MASRPLTRADSVERSKRAALSASAISFVPPRPAPEDLPALPSTADGSTSRAPAVQPSAHAEVVRTNSLTVSQVSPFRVAPDLPPGGERA